MEGKQLQNGNSYPVEKLQSVATMIAKSGLFPDINTTEKAFTLMMLCQAEGLHPVQALKRYNIIQNKPAMKADAMLAEFNRRGGKVNWLEYNDKAVEAEFIHPNGSSIKVKWTFDMASQIKQGNYSLTSKDNWRNYPRQMLKARVISEGIRAIMPEVCAGIYTPEEVQDFVETPTLTPPQPVKPPENEPKQPEIATENTQAIPNTAPAEKPAETAKNSLNIAEEYNNKFKELKKRLGEEDFYYILKRYGANSLKDIKTIEKARRVIKAMESVLEDRQ